MGLSWEGSSLGPCGMFEVTLYDYMHMHNQIHPEEWTICLHLGRCYFRLLVLIKGKSYLFSMIYLSCKGLGGKKYGKDTPSVFLFPEKFRRWIIFFFIVADTITIYVKS